MPEIPYGHCYCGCGRRTTIIAKTSTADGRFRGQPNKFIKGHHARLLPREPDYKIDLETGCWVWQRYITEDGYGRIHLRSSRPANVLAHRWYYEQHVGPIPDGLEIDHLCRNRACVNPDHLEPVTSRENVLRGVGPSAQYAKRTHCAHGHPLTDENVRIVQIGNGTVRRCRTCKRESATRAA